MPSPRLLIMLLFISGCAEHPDPTTAAIAEADRAGGICATDSVILIGDHATTRYECADRALHGISALVYDAPE